MKNTFLLALLCAFSFSVSAQIPKEAFDLTNGLSDLWKTSNTEKAVEATLKLNTLHQPFLLDNLHHSLAQVLKRDRSLRYPQKYLQSLWDLQNPSIRSVIEPMYVWNSAFEVDTLPKAKSLIIRFQSLLRDTANTKAKTEFYGLMLLKTLNDKGMYPKEEATALLEKITANLQRYPFLDKPNVLQAANRAWHRYLFSYCMFQKYLNQGEKPEYLKMASNYSPDPMDLSRREGYFYDAALLESKTSNIGFQYHYIRYLDKSQRYAEELAVLLELTYCNPENLKLTNLKNFLSKHPELSEFKQVWSNYVASKMIQAPTLKITYETDVFDFTKPRQNWTFIDVWGTWCSPCVKELPHLNEVAAKYNSLPESKIRIRTFSYMSTNLKAFLETNKYTFPVAEVGQEVTVPFGINSYPTKLLVSPDNKYLIIPFNVNWEEYMRNYCMIE